MVEKNLTQREILAEKLLSIAPDVTTTDKRDFENEKNISHMTINKYLRGDVVNVEIAIPMLQFFTERINARTKQIESVGN